MDIINKKELFEKFEPSLIAGLYDRFMNSYEEKLVLIKTFLMNNAYEELGEIAHQFKSQFGYFCAHKIFVYFQNMENFVNSPPEKKYKEICDEIDTLLSEFILDLGSVKKKLLDDDRSIQRKNAASGEEEQSPANEKAKKKILIAEDDKISQMVLKMMLQKNFEVFLASTGIQALDLYRNELPDLVLMDINMPVLNGYGAIKKIRAESKHQVPIIAVTALFLEEEREKLIKAGFENVIVKPYVESDIFKYIKQYL